MSDEKPSTSPTAPTSGTVQTESGTVGGFPPMVNETKSLEKPIADKFPRFERVTESDRGRRQR